MNLESTTDWPCGGVTSYPSTSGAGICFAANTITVWMTAERTTMSVVLRLPVATDNYDFKTVVTSRTLNVARFGTFCFCLGPTND